MLNRYNFAIAELAPDDEERLQLCGIYITPDETIETDGHQAVIVSAVENTQPTLFEETEGVEPADYFTPFILDRESALKIAKAIPKKTENPEARYAVVDATTENNDRAMVSVNDVFRQEILKANKLQGDFPNVRRLVPDREAARFSVAFNPDLLLRILKSVNGFCNGHETHSITMSFYEPNQGVRIDASGVGQTYVAVVMPQRSDS